MLILSIFCNVLRRGRTKNRKNQHLFRHLRFEKVEKETNIFQKIQKRTTEKSKEPWIFLVLFLKKNKKKRKNSIILCLTLDYIDRICGSFAFFLSFNLSFSNNDLNIRF